MQHCLHTLDELTEQLRNEFFSFLAAEHSRRMPVSIAFSGGSTPRALFEKMAALPLLPGEMNPWKQVHIFWADERCVPPDHPDSNYGMTKDALLDVIKLPGHQIHRIRGEREPDAEVHRYSQEIMNILPKTGEAPVFGWIFLGVGEDGHTASIFPDRPDLFDTHAVCATASHPATGQMRITLTGKTILQARRITFLVSGASKSMVIKKIFQHAPEAIRYPAAWVYEKRPDADWYLDAAAAKLL
jgi:6-phosphogluconolactonase